jgi:hypothetical protein
LVSRVEIEGEEDKEGGAREKRTENRSVEKPCKELLMGVPTVRR